MADQVVLLHQGQVEQCAAPRSMYAQPATTFAAKFIGTPAMNLLRLQGGVIAGSEVRLPAPPHAVYMGLRPETVAIGNEGTAARITGIEYLGADVVLRCAIGSEHVTVRAPGQQQAGVGQTVPLVWRTEDMHFFDAQGQRMA